MFRKTLADDRICYKKTSFAEFRGCSQHGKVITFRYRGIDRKIFAVRGVYVTTSVASTKLPYVGPGYYWNGRLSSDGRAVSVCNEPPRPTQPPILGGTGVGS